MTVRPEGANHPGVARGDARRTNARRSLNFVAIFVATRTAFVRVSGGYRAEIELQKPLFYKG